MEKELKAQHKKKRTFKEMREICENRIAVAIKKESFAGNYQGPLYAPHPHLHEEAEEIDLVSLIEKNNCNHTIEGVNCPCHGKKRCPVVMESAWTRKEGKNKNGGLNEKGRKSYERENPGSDLKAPSKKVGNPRRASFCARMKGMRKRQKDSNNTGEDRLSKSLRAWNC